MGEQQSSTVTVDAAPLSSVQIEGRSKGPPAVTVKVYHADPAVAAARAIELYGLVTAHYTEDEPT